MNSIFLSISGGLGNQLFQIAAGYYLKQKLDSDVCLVFADEINTPHKLGIMNFLDSLSLKSALLKDVAHKELYELEISNLSDFSAVPRGKIISGYFQDWRIVNDLDDFVDLLKQSVTKNGWSEEFIQSNQGNLTVSIHYRLGDYFNNLHALGVLDASYYKAAIARLDLALPHRLIVFSDSPAKASQLFSKVTDEFVLVDDSDAASPLDVMIALGSCNQIILGNSTFSWWAAYMGNQSKIIAPFPFYRDLTRDFLLPPTWERVQSRFLKADLDLKQKMIRKLNLRT